MTPLPEVILFGCLVPLLEIFDVSIVDITGVEGPRAQIRFKKNEGVCPVFAVSTPPTLLRPDVGGRCGFENESQI
jgi:hypothetical protein